jgi:hypothetical protein
MERIDRIFWLPPLAIARLGDSEMPLESFVWADPQSVEAQGTVISPDITLEVLPDGSVRPYLPEVIRFRDGGRLRPVAPFFELWASVQGEDQSISGHPVTLALLERLEASTRSVQYTITVANRKAQRRTGSPSCAYVARVSVNGSDHDRKELRAFSPHSQGLEPLVDPARPISLGHFQVIRPVPSSKEVDKHSVDLSVLRVRFTPARGEVYGPPTATAGPASPLPPGQALALETLGGRLHEIVPERNRVLNPNTPWSQYAMKRPGQRDPQPSDSYDGANVGDNRSWGVVDDTCDGVIQAELVVQGERWVATARVVSACPDFAPDRRTFYSLADDLTDRDLEPFPRRPQTVVEVPVRQMLQIHDEVADLFERVFETASLMNLDATRIHGIGENEGTPNVDYPALPPIDDRSMSKDDPLARLTMPLPRGVEPTRQLRYTNVARLAHAPLANRRELMERLRSNAVRVKSMLRPPYGRFRQLKPQPAPEPENEFRDPRVVRDIQQDMRMPPYMRDSDQTPLSLTWCQYETVAWLLQAFEVRRAVKVLKKVFRTEPRR